MRNVQGNFTFQKCTLNERSIVFLLKELFSTQTARILNYAQIPKLKSISEQYNQVAIKENAEEQILCNLPSS